MQAKDGIAAFIVRPLLTPLLTCPRSRSSLEKRPALRLEGRPKNLAVILFLRQLFRSQHVPEFVHRFGKRLVVFDAVGVAADVGV